MKIISWKNFEALSINEKLNFVGHLIFTKNQISLLNELLDWDEVTTKDLSDSMDKSKRSIASTSSSINRKFEDTIRGSEYNASLIDIDQSIWGDETYLQLDQDELKIWLQDAYDTYLIDNDIMWPYEEEEEVQASEEEEVQAEELQLTDNQKQVLNAIEQNGKTTINVNRKTSVDVNELCDKFNLNNRSFKRTVNSLIKKGLLIETKETEYTWDGHNRNKLHFTFVEIKQDGKQYQIEKVIYKNRFTECVRVEIVQAEEEEVQAEEVQASEEEEVQAEEVQASEEEEVQASESKTIKRLKPSTIKRYTVEQIANHADNYQLAIDTDEYRFDFQFKSIYTKGGNQYYYYMDMLDTDYNKMMITSILESIYQLHNIKIMEESIKQMKGA